MGPAVVVAVQLDPDTGNVDTYWLALGTVLIRAGKHHVFKRTVCLSLQKHAISLYDAGISVKKMHHCLGKKYPAKQKCRFLLFTLAFKTCNKKHAPPYRLSMARPVKIEFRLSQIFTGSIQYFIAKTSALQYVFPQLNFPAAVLMSLLSGPCRLLLPGVQATDSSGLTTASRFS